MGWRDRWMESRGENGGFDISFRSSGTMLAGQDRRSLLNDGHFCESPRPLSPSASVSGLSQPIHQLHSGQRKHRR
jgi:hypothetical protein